MRVSPRILAGLQLLSRLQHLSVLWPQKRPRVSVFLGFVKQTLRPVELVREPVRGGRIRTPAYSEPAALVAQGL